MTRVAVDATPQLVGRERESERLAAFAAAIPSGARALIIRGEPGIGKTTLWREGVEACERAGYGVAVTRPAEEEMPLGLTGLTDLFEGGGLEPGPEVTGDNPHARGRAVLATLREVAACKPVLIAVDDVQWLDGGSARALRFALRRLDTEPVGVLATLRPEADPLQLASTLPPGRTEELVLGPLDRRALRRLLARALDAVSAPTLQRIHEVSGGNPLYALELARALTDDQHAGRLPLPDSLQAAIADRLAGVEDLVELLQIVSALGQSSVRALRDGLPDADAQLEAAQRQGLLVVGEDLRVRFSHPLIGSVVYSRMSPLTRRALHARLAAAADDPDVRARHLALSTDEPDAGVAELLEEAAGRAREREAFDRAAEFAGHSARLTPPDERAAALRRGLAEIDNRAIAGEMRAAVALADRLVAAARPGRERGEVLLQRAYLEDEDIQAGVTLLRQAVDEADDERLRGRILDHLGWTLALFAGELPEGLANEDAALAALDPNEDSQHWMSTAGTLAYIAALGGAPRPELMARAVAIERESGKPILWTSPRTLEAETLLWAGELAAARAQFEAVRSDAARTGTRLHLPYSMFDLALVDCAAGDFDQAEALGREGVEAARDADDTWAERLLLYPLALVDAWRGRADRARAHAQQRLDEARDKGERPGVVRARTVLGLLALSQGDNEAAARELAEAAELLAAMGYAHPGAFPVLPDAVEALACCGEYDGAAVLLARLDAEAAATGSGWARAVADRARGALALARGDADAAGPPLRDAAHELERLGYRPDAARAVFLRGRALLRGGQRAQAADALADAQRRFAALGAPLWEARAAGELERAAPGRATGELTPAERKIAALVAQGMRNREIGQTLFMSVATVEAHLTRTYRKLGIRSRSELARRVNELGETR